MSEKQVAFLRTINVGRRRISMAEFCSELSAGGFSDVETHRASGNVVFDSDTPCGESEARMERHLADAFGYEDREHRRKMGLNRAWP